MSLVPFTFTNVELKVVTINGKPWTRAKEVCEALEYNKKTSKTANIIRAHCSRENFAHKHDLSSVHATDDHLFNWPIDSQKYNIYINEEGLRELVRKSKQPCAAKLAKDLDIDVYKHKYTSKENDSIEIIMKTFHGEKVKRQFKIGNYRINLYLLNYKIAIECDEFDHIDRDINYEITRQKFIEE